MLSSRYPPKTTTAPGKICILCGEPFGISEFVYRGAVPRHRGTDRVMFGYWHHRHGETPDFSLAAKVSG